MDTNDEIIQLKSVKTVDLIREFIRRCPENVLVLPNGKNTVTITTQDLLNQLADSEDVFEIYGDVGMIIRIHKDTSNRICEIMRNDSKEAQQKE